MSETCVSELSQLVYKQAFAVAEREMSYHECRDHNRPDECDDAKNYDRLSDEHFEEMQKTLRKCGFGESAE